MIASKQYLYLLVFQNQPLFKIGISSNSLKRSELLSGLYNIDFDQSLIITCAKDSYIPVLERELLLTFDIVDNRLYKHLQGNTEIRDIKDFSNAVQIIKQKSPNLEIKIYPFQIVRQFEEKKNLPKKVKRVRPLLKNSCRLEEFKNIQNEFIIFFGKLLPTINNVSFVTNSDADIWTITVKLSAEYMKNGKGFLSLLWSYGGWVINSFDHCSSYNTCISSAKLFNVNGICEVRFYIAHKLNNDGYILVNNLQKCEIRNTYINRRHLTWLQMELRNKLSYLNSDNTVKLSQ